MTAPAPRRSDERVRTYVTGSKDPKRGQRHGQVSPTKAKKRDEERTRFQAESLPQRNDRCLIAGQRGMEFFAVILRQRVSRLDARARTAYYNAAIGEEKKKQFFAARSFALANCLLNEYS